MVVFPAPSSPKMRILISLVPNKLEKMVEKKPPTKKKSEQKAISMSAGDMETDLISDWTAMCFLSSVKKDKFRLPLGHLWAELYPSFLALCHYVVVDLPSKIKLHRASSLWLGVFSFSPTCQNLSQLLLYLYWPSVFSLQETIQGHSEAWNKFSWCLQSPRGPSTYSFLKWSANQQVHVKSQPTANNEVALS